MLSFISLRLKNYIFIGFLILTSLSFGQPPCGRPPCGGGQGGGPGNGNGNPNCAACVPINQGESLLLLGALALGYSFYRRDRNAEKK